jgi:tetratricopeptide (TPR) repeat protein
MRPFYPGCFGALLLCAITIVAKAQMPSIKTDGAESGQVFLQKLEVNVVIDGALATTTWTMTFKNTTKKILEGELNFPLPQGTTVSKYALDINGVMRDAVPVEKEKATEVFENTERRRIDPGLLEKVDGNSFRTRIYPINANGERTVRIGYEQELSWEGLADLRYRLPLAFTHPLEEFSVNISVPGAAHQPRFDENTDNALVFNEWKEVWSASRKWANYLADQPISIRIPQPPGSGALLMQQVGNHYFYSASIFPRQERMEKPLPHHITLLWDVSLSGLKRDRKREFDLLDAYFSRLGNVDVDVVPFSNVVSTVSRFTVHNGDWQSLRKDLENVVYDGGTQFGVLRLSDYPCDEFLLFSDGHSNFGSDRIQTNGKPLYAIVTAADADFPFLQLLSEGTGGELINLNNMSIVKGRDLLCYRNLQFLGVRHSEDLEESYPSIPTTLNGGLTVCGICYKPAKELVLQFGYGDKVIREEKLVLDFPRQQSVGTDVSRIWAEKKIAELDRRYEDNKYEIRHLGRSYGIVTRNTSLVVLENVMDYVTNEIEPPADLRQEYDRILKEREGNGQWQRQRVADNAEQYFNELLAWWRGEGEPVTQASSSGTPPPPATPRPREGAPVPRREAPDGSARRDVTGAASGYLAADSIRYTAPALAGGNLQGRVAGVQIRGVASAPPASSQHLDEVVVVGFSAQKRKSITAERERDDDEPSPAPTPDRGRFTVLKADVNTKYIGALRAAAPANRYALYLQLRKEYLNTPLFYFHTAELFLGAGEKAIGLRILSNIAELDAENYELYKLMAYKLKEAGEAEAACATFKKVLDWRPFEPQSYRDYALALEDAGHYQQALDTLYLALTKNYSQTTEALYPGFEETILPELNELVARHPGLNIGRIPRKLLTNLPVDMRVVLNWNQNNTDIDLWVTDPDNERCFYGHRFTAMGGRISHDFTNGLGPEQFLLKKAVKGRYKVEVNYYGDRQVKLAGETTLMVEVYTNYGSPQQKRTLVTLQLKPGSKGAVYVGDFDF